MEKTLENEIVKLKNEPGPAIDPKIMEGIKLNQKSIDLGLTTPYKRKIYSPIQSLKY